MASIPLMPMTWSPTQTLHNNGKHSIKASDLTTFNRHYITIKGQSDCWNEMPLGQSGSAKQLVPKGVWELGVSQRGNMCLREQWSVSVCRKPQERAHGEVETPRRQSFIPHVKLYSLMSTWRTASKEEIYICSLWKLAILLVLYLWRRPERLELLGWKHAGATPGFVSQACINWLRNLKYYWAHSFI